MELALDMCLMPFGPRARVACTPGLAADGERRFVEEEAGPGVMCEWEGRRVEKKGSWAVKEVRTEREREDRKSVV